MPAELGCIFAAKIDQVATADLVFLWLILLEIDSTCEVENRCSAIKRRILLPCYFLTLFFLDVSDAGTLLTLARALKARLGNGIWKVQRLPFLELPERRRNI